MTDKTTDIWNEANRLLRLRDGVKVTDFSGDSVKVRYHLNKLVKSGHLTVTKRNRWEKQGGHAHAFFGGAGVRKVTWNEYNLKA